MEHPWQELFMVSWQQFFYNANHPCDPRIFTRHLERSAVDAKVGRHPEDPMPAPIPSDQVAYLAVCSQYITSFRLLHP